MIVKNENVICECINVKKLNENAVIPKKAHDADAGFDMVATSREETELFIEYGTGIAISIPKGYVGLIFPRSSITKKRLMLKNSTGVIDSGYTGEIKFRFQKIMAYEFINNNNFTYDYTLDKHIYNIGDKIGQIIFQKLPEIKLVEVDNFTETTERGEGGFGSTDFKN